MILKCYVNPKNQITVVFNSYYIDNCSVFSPITAISNIYKSVNI